MAAMGYDWDTGSRRPRNRLRKRKNNAYQLGTYRLRMQIHQIFMIYQKVKNNLGYFLKLFRLGKKEGLTPERSRELKKVNNNADNIS